MKRIKSWGKFKFITHLACYRLCGLAGYYRIILKIHFGFIIISFDFYIIYTLSGYNNNCNKETVFPVTA